jgi:transglycosylase-like protein with SLT domain
MEKRNQNTLARTLRCGTQCVTVTLIVALFVPGLLTLKNVSRHETTPQTPPPPGTPNPEDIQSAPPAEVPPPRDLVRLYAIVKANRPDISDGEIWELADAVKQECKKRGLDPILVLALIQVESGFRFKAVSPMGARGIMQIMPEVAQNLAHEIGYHPHSEGRHFRPEFLDDPFYSIKLGVYYLQGLKKSFRDVTTTLIAYNLGPTELRNRLDNNIDFSDEYASLVLSAYQKLKQTKQPTF